MKIKVFILLLIVLSGCSSNNISIISKDSLEEKLNIVDLKKNGIIAKDAKEVFVADVGNKDGASFSINIDLSDNFNTKASTNGTVAKTFNDIKSVSVYLIKSSSSTYPLNGDPLGATDLVAGPFTLSRSGAGPYTITFTNVGASPSGTSYFAAVRAFDNVNATGNELIKNNNGSATAWTGTTASTNRVAVSTGSGVNVNSSLVVNTTTPLPLTINLTDAIGATIDASVTPASGSNTLPAIGAN